MDQKKNKVSGSAPFTREGLRITLSEEELKSLVKEAVKEHVSKALRMSDFFGRWATNLVSSLLTEEDLEELRNKIKEELAKAIEETDFKEEVKLQIKKYLKDWVYDLLEEIVSKRYNE